MSPFLRAVTHAMDSASTGWNAKNAAANYAATTFRMLRKYDGYDNEGTEQPKRRGARAVQFGFGRDDAHSLALRRFSLFCACDAAWPNN